MQGALKLKLIRSSCYWCLPEGQSYKKGPALRRTYPAEVGPQPTMPIENKAPVSAVHRQKQHQFAIKTVLSILMPFYTFTVKEHSACVWKKQGLLLWEEVWSFRQYVWFRLWELRHCAVQQVIANVKEESTASIFFRCMHKIPVGILPRKYTVL